MQQVGFTRARKGAVARGRGEDQATRRCVSLHADVCAVVVPGEDFD